MTFRRALTALAAAALATPLTIVAAQAATPPTTISIHATNEAGDPLSDILVYALEDEAKGGAWVTLGATNTDGDLTKARGIDSAKLTAGEWDLAFFDTDDARDAAGTSFATLERTVTIVAGQENVQPTTVLVPGSRITGTVTAPSGRPVRNVELDAVPENDGFGSSDLTDKTGAYSLNGIPDGTWSVDAYRSPVWDWDDIDSKEVATGIRFTGPSQVKHLDVKRFTVRCERSASVTSPSRGTVKIVARATAADFGLAKPGGKLAIYRNGTRLRTVAFTGTTKTFTYTHQKPGSKASYRVSYGSGDCLSWSSTKKVTVRR